MSCLLLHQGHELLDALDGPLGRHQVEHAPHRLAEVVRRALPPHLEGEVRARLRGGLPGVGVREAPVDPRHRVHVRVALVDLGAPVERGLPEVLGDGVDTLLPPEPPEAPAEVHEAYPAFLIIAARHVERVGEVEVVVERPDRGGAVERLVHAGDLPAPKDDDEDDPWKAEPPLLERPAGSVGGARAAGHPAHLARPGRHLDHDGRHLTPRPRHHGPDLPRVEAPALGAAPGGGRAGDELVERGGAERLAVPPPGGAVARHLDDGVARRRLRRAFLSGVLDELEELPLAEELLLVHLVAVDQRGGVRADAEDGLRDEARHAHPLARELHLLDVRPRDDAYHARPGGRGRRNGRRLHRLLHRLLLSPALHHDSDLLPCSAGTATRSTFTTAWSSGMRSGRMLRTLSRVIVRQRSTKYSIVAARSSSSVRGRGAVRPARMSRWAMRASVGRTMPSAVAAPVARSAAPKASTRPSASCTRSSSPRMPAGAKIRSLTASPNSRASSSWRLTTPLPSA